MDLETKTPRKRGANFSSDEKALLAQLIKERPIIESKLSDGKTVSKKQAAWNEITQEFNYNSNVQKRETIMLKKAWENMKAWTRKAQASERGNLLITGDVPQVPPLTPQNGAIISMDEEAAPIMFCEVKNEFDSDDAALEANDNSQELNGLDNYDKTLSKGQSYIKSRTVKKPAAAPINPKRKPSDYIRREAVMRIKYLENKKKMEMQILRTQLEVEQTKKKSALLEQEKNKILLEKAKMELEELKNEHLKNNIG